MKTIDFSTLERINGGNAVEFVDGACAVVAMAGVLGYFAVLNPFSAAVVGFCVGWGIGCSLPT